MNNPFKYLSPCLFFFLLFISALCQGQVVVENPSFSTTNTRFLEIEKVELQDTVTILHVKGFNHPRYWIRIAKTACIVADGNKYVVQRSEGMKLDKKEYT